MLRLWRVCSVVVDRVTFVALDVVRVCGFLHVCHWISPQRNKNGSMFLSPRLQPGPAPRLGYAGNSFKLCR